MTRRTTAALMCAAVLLTASACGDGEASTQPPVPGPLVTPSPFTTLNGYPDFPFGVSRFTVDVDGRKVDCVYVDNGNDGGPDCNWGAVPVPTVTITSTPTFGGAP